MNYTHIIFDLDGTLSDPADGLKGALKYSLAKMNITLDIETKFRDFVGPPLHMGFKSVFDMPEKDIDEAVFHFREYYGKKGVYENKPYPEIIDMLKNLNEMGKTLYIATSKLEKYAHTILEYYKMDVYFSDVKGAGYVGFGSEKETLVKNIINENKLQQTHSIAMVGDKHFDMHAATANNIDPVGVLYGYGSKKELENSGAKYLMKDVTELKKHLSY